MINNRGLEVIKERDGKEIKGRGEKGERSMHELRKRNKSLVKEDLTVHCSLVGAFAIDAWSLLCGQ